MFRPEQSEESRFVYIVIILFYKQEPSNGNKGVFTALDYAATPHKC